MHKLKRVKLMKPILYNNNILCTQTYNSASSVHNYVLNDPILDVFKYTTIYDNLKTKDNIDESENKFLNILFEQGIKFEKEIMDVLSKRTDMNIVTISTSREESLRLEKYQETINCLKNGVPFIYQAPLHTQDPNFLYYGTPDLIAKISELKKFIKNLDIPDHYDDYYAIVDIKYSSIKFKANGINILTTGRMKANACQTVIYNTLLKQLQSQIPNLKVFNETFILGRSYKLSNGVAKHDCFYTLGTTENVFGSRYFSEIADWMMEVKSGNIIRDVYPNMCNNYDTPWHKLKTTIAKKNDELTSVYRITHEDRETLVNLGIKKWSDPNFLSTIETFRKSKYYKSDLLKNIVSVNIVENEFKKQCSLDYFYRIDNNLLHQFKLIHTSTTNNTIGQYFIDIERTTNMISLDNMIPNTYRPSHTFMIGIYCRNEYYSFLKYDNSKEEDIYIRAIKFIENDALKCGYKDYKLYHWGQIEQTYLVKAIPQYDTSKMCDLYTSIINMNFSIKGSLSYSIKDIANSMLNSGLIYYKQETAGINGQMAAVLSEIYYKNDNCNNNSSSRGYSSSSSSIETYIHENMNINGPANIFKCFKEIVDIIQYNRQDCIMLERIFTFLMNIKYVNKPVIIRNEVEMSD